MFLYDKIEQSKNFGAYAELPKYIEENLNPNFELRPYQIMAFRNFITYFTNNNFRTKPSDTLFHMATGSGKTLIMAGLILYLYKQGYHNFMFFVNSTNIIRKTKENFLNTKSSKYLFAEEINIDGERVAIKEINNFSETEDTGINICFTTIQKLHIDMQTPKENSVTFEDFEGRKIVFISDEAHHLNAVTKKGKLTKEETLNYNSWENTIKNIIKRCPDNVMLEFTATCELDNPNIKNAYENKIVCQYDLRSFNADGYSKDIFTMRTDLAIMDKVLLALVFSQYRLKVFQRNKLNIKPVIMCKADTIKHCEEQFADFATLIKTLNGDKLKEIKNNSQQNEIASEVFKWYETENISLDDLANELKIDFAEEHCIALHENSIDEEKQLALNTLEDKDNGYRLIFAVDMLNEGWDVLNLFDIVRLYETRQSGGKAISPTTTREAQLIGRGARYCPFQITKEQEKFKRKYDSDAENPLRICEQLFYHCQNDSRYIAELHTAMSEIGLTPEPTKKQLKLKDSFKQEDLYNSGFAFVNERIIKSRADVYGLPEKIRNKVYTYTEVVGAGGIENLLKNDNYRVSENSVETYLSEYTILEIAQINYAIVYKALAKFTHNFTFDVLQKIFPHLTSTREFIYSEKYLGNIKVEIRSNYSKENVPVTVLFEAVMLVLNNIKDELKGVLEFHEGTKQFTPVAISNLFKDKVLHYVKVDEKGEGTSQNGDRVDANYRFDLSQVNWYAFNDNYGTTLEKEFVGYFRGIVGELQQKYDKVFLVRNERQLVLFSFDDGERFEPDFVLFLQKEKGGNMEQLQVFIEPKGEQLFEKDKWKEKFLLEIEDKADIETINLLDNTKFKVWGLHFYNPKVTGQDDLFRADMKKVVEN